MGTETMSKYRIELDADLIGKHLKFGVGDQLNQTVKDQIAFIKENGILIEQEGKQSFYEVDSDFFKGQPSGQCSICGNVELKEKSRTVKFFSACDCIVQVKDVKYFFCPGCKYDICDDGEKDCIWFLSCRVAVSLKVIWDCMTGLFNGHIRNITSFCELRTLGIQSKMGGNLHCRFISGWEFSTVLFGALEQVILDLRYPCLGHAKDAIGYPDSSDPKAIRSWIQRASKNPNLFDCGHIGFDGTPNVFAVVNKNSVDGLKNPAGGPKKADGTGTASTDKSAMVSRGMPQSLQHDRCGIMTANHIGTGQPICRLARNPEPGDRALASGCRGELVVYGKLVQSQSSVKVSVNSQSDNQDKLLAAAASLGVQLDQFAYTQCLKPIVQLCSRPGQFFEALGPERSNLFLFCSGDVIQGLGAAASVLTFLKPNVVPLCMDCCNTVLDISKSVAQVADQVARQKVINMLSALNCSTTSYPAASCLYLLVSFIDLESKRSLLQDSINIAVVSLLAFVCSRVTSVMAAHNMSEDVISALHQEDQCSRLNFVEGEYNPPAQGAAYNFTMHGKQIRHIDNGDSNFENDCKEKPSFALQAATSKRRRLRSLMTCMCMEHNMFIGFHEIGKFGLPCKWGESWRDVYNAVTIYKESCPISTTYDTACS